MAMICRTALIHWVWVWAYNPGTNKNS